jgi:hypothetical protein
LAVSIKRERERERERARTVPHAAILGNFLENSALPASYRFGIPHTEKSVKLRRGWLLQNRKET